MPIYEYYCRENHTIYQFYAKTLAQGRTSPKCPDNPKFKLTKMVSAFAISSGSRKDEASEANPVAGAGEADDPRMEAAMNAMEKEFSSVDENDPKAMARMMRRMSELTGERIDGEMEEVVRKLEEGADPDSLEETLGGDEAGANPDDPYGMGGPDEPKPADPKEAKFRFKIRRVAPRRDPKLYDYE